MRRRPVLFASAAVVGLWSAWIVVHGQAGQSPVVVAAREPRHRAPPPEAARPAATPAVAAASSTAPDTARPRLSADGDDAFASREWYRPPPPPPPPPPAAPVPPPPPPPPPPPTLPYRFVGLLDEGRGSPPRVFLALGEKLLVAGVGDRLEGGYQLMAISPQELVFQHIHDNVTLKLAVAGGNT